MVTIRKLLQNRDFILFLSLFLGLIWGKAAYFTKDFTLIVLAVIMTISTMTISSNIFLSPRVIFKNALVGILMNYVVLGGIILALNSLLIHEKEFWTGFIIIIVVPPAVAVIPFTTALEGNINFSLGSTIGTYLAALVITPLISIWLLGTRFIHPGKLFIILVELILIPLIFSRILRWIKLAEHLEPVKGVIINWGFFVIVYTVVGLNRKVFLTQPLLIVEVAAISFASTFLLGLVIESIGKIFKIDSKTVTSIVLLGTLKNYGLAAGLSLTLFTERTAIPATVSAVFLIIFIIWLSFKKRVFNF